jgi:hypothetical protein
MNRFEKEEKRKYKEARKGLSQEQISILDEKERLDARINELAHNIHCDKFPEEYDFMYDSTFDIADRNNGINPMNQEYIEKINKKRQALGVSLLSDCGMSTSNETLELCKKEAKKIILKE